MRGAFPVLAGLALLSAPLFTTANAEQQALADMQCGGVNWLGATKCERGYQCTKINAFVSTCQPSRRRLACKRKTKAPSTSSPSTTPTPATTATPATTGPTLTTAPPASNSGSSTGAEATSAPATTAPSTTAPSTTAPSTTAPSTTAPSTTAPSTTSPSTSAPTTTAPASDEASTAPSTSSPATPAVTTKKPTGPCANAYQQCGGQPFDGPTCCVDGYVCDGVDEFYMQCVPPSRTHKPKPTTEAPADEANSSTPDAGNGQQIYLTYDTTKVTPHKQAAYPPATAKDCGSWKPVDGVCVPTYCKSNNKSEDCKSCSGSDCVAMDPKWSRSGNYWGEQTTVTSNEQWHYSRSTHFGLVTGGACSFGYYGLCTKGSKTASWVDPMLGGQCDAFCKAYPVLCQDPKDRQLRGNFAAPNGNYYTQFWSVLEGERDNYLSCGECFEMLHTKPDGTDYKPGEAGYQEPIIVEITDSCPCNANSKWCCGPGADHCGEINFKYGCPLPEGSHHMDLSDIAMGRLEGNGSLPGVVPTRYRRTPCPKPGNIYLWLRDSGGPYYFALTVVNTAGVGSVAKVEIKTAKIPWTKMVRDPNFTPARNAERFGTWTIPQGSGPFQPPIAMRITSPNGEQVVNMQAIKSFTAPATALKEYNYIDFGAQFSIDGKH